ncbi:MAG TPA: phenylalanine--tRNA ligase subunit beta [Longimicrobiales bacterium]|nr:phenylalanine--tRNA ligase subunit beta [Longimicrobiales bacterium]
MDISYRWLRALAPSLEDGPERVAERLAMYGAPVDEVVRLDAGLADIVVGRVLAMRAHPDADRLSVCRVDAGGEPLEVVCGAPNVREGGLYPFAPEGVLLPGGLEIRAATIRGVTSHGMLCSERELGLGRDHTGIMELHGDFRPGEPLVGALGLDDVRLVLDVTPNRPDLLSHMGVARELAPGGDADLALPEIPGDAGAAARVSELTFRRTKDAGVVDGVDVRIDDPAGCPRYVAAVVRGVQVAPSPEWLAGRLRAAGLRPINNVVDATNYVLLELGQPLHAFDLGRLDGPEIRVRRARAGERITTLDGEKRTLAAFMVVIADAGRPLAVAGVMGGADSEVDASTTDVLLECALFDPKSIRATRNALGMSTDASYRYERGVDVEGMERAARRALELILALAGGTPAPEAADVYPDERKAPVVSLRPSRVARLLGAAVEDAAIVGYLAPLGFAAVKRGKDRIDFRVPGHRRYDVSREVDLIEEVARRHGYDAFPDTLHPFRASGVADDALLAFQARLRRVLAGAGFLEARHVPFVPEAEGDVALLHPLSQEESRLRRELAPRLVRAVESNLAHGVRDVRLFELGTVFAPAGQGEQPREAVRVAAVFTGARHAPHWSGEAQTYDIWDAKGVLDRLADVLGLEAAVPADGVDAGARSAAAAPLTTPHGRVLEADARFVVRQDGAGVGLAGRVRDDALDAPAWAGPVWAVEVTLTDAMLHARPPRYRPLPAYPPIERDLALVVPDTLPAQQVGTVARAAAGELLEEVRVFDVYRGKGVPEGHRSIAFRLRFRSPERTLTDDDADAAVARVLNRLQEELGVRRRG